MWWWIIPLLIATFGFAVPALNKLDRIGRQLEAIYQLLDRRLPPRD